MLSVLAEYLYSTQMVNPILAEHIYMMSELCVRYKNIYLPVQYFSVKILIYSATLTDFLNANLIIFLRD